LHLHVTYHLSNPSPMLGVDRALSLQPPCRGPARSVLVWCWGFKGQATLVAGADLKGGLPGL
jgi:hypothetical protein